MGTLARSDLILVLLIFLETLAILAVESNEVGQQASSVNAHYRNIVRIRFANSLIRECTEVHECREITYRSMRQKSENETPIAGRALPLYPG